MPMTALTGSRVRERRLALGLRQADLARTAAISASYLNLIEHNRRRIGPEVLGRLAAALGIGVEALGAGAEAALSDELRAAAAEGALSVLDRPELDRIDDFLGRFPGWAGLMAAQHRRLGQLERAVGALNDRIAHDPHLSSALHEMLSAVSSVRSTAAILAETEDIEPEWRARFHRNLHGDSERLALGAEALVAYLDGSDQAADQGDASPQEEVDAWAEARGWQVADGEGLGELASGAARVLGEALVAQAMADARALPAGAFGAALAELGAEPMLLAQRFGAEVPAVMRRLATWPGSRAGLVECDASGTLIFRKPAEGFALPRFGAACALWPLFTALARPMSPVEAVVETAGRGGQRYRIKAFCRPRHPLGFGGPEVREAAMLIEPEPQGGPGWGGEGSGGAALPIGTSCRICPRGGCPARREPSILSETVG
ncbi:short-chain fatty acyl-CoA regulator family protein [Paracoccaceae bacterium Fryx2]|nr:short-chain fatty acyl-CoA regulator family protein [Paracoccaceae bacterium Fryx2]